MKNLSEFAKETIKESVSNIHYYEESGQRDVWSIGVTTSDSSVTKFNRLDCYRFVDHAFQGDFFIFNEKNEILGRSDISKAELEYMLKLDESDYNKTAGAAWAVIDKANEILSELWKDNLTRSAEYTFTPLDRSIHMETDGDAYLVAVDTFDTGFSESKGISWHFVVRKGNKWTGIGISGHQHILSDSVNCVWFITDANQYKDFPSNMGADTYRSTEHRVYKIDKSEAESYIKRIDALRKEAMKVHSTRNSVKSAAGECIMKSMTAYNKRLR